MLGKKIQYDSAAMGQTLIESLKGVLHLLPQINMFCALSQNSQYLLEK